MLKVRVSHAEPPTLRRSASTGSIQAAGTASMEPTQKHTMPTLQASAGAGADNRTLHSEVRDTRRGTAHLMPKLLFTQPASGANAVQLTLAHVRSRP